jgi:hypothetical protein
MFRQPVMVFEGSKEFMATAHGRALQREIEHSVFTQDLFATGNDRDNRAAVKAVSTPELDLVGIAVYGPRNAVDKVLKGATNTPLTRSRSARFEVLPGGAGVGADGEAGGVAFGDLGAVEEVGVAGQVRKDARGSGVGVGHIVADPVQVWCGVAGAATEHHGGAVVQGDGAGIQAPTECLAPSSSGRRDRSRFRIVETVSERLPMVTAVATRVLPSGLTASRPRWFFVSSGAEPQVAPPSSVQTMSVRPIPVSAQQRPPVSQTGDRASGVSSIRTVESSRFTMTIRPGTIRSVRISPLRKVRVGRT